MKSTRIFLVLLILSITTVSGQSDLLKGKLIDAKTIEPVAFATVRVKGRAIGVVSNADGSFQIPKKFKVHGDTLEISSMGYENREILISTLTVDKIRTIYIQPALFELNEAVVKAKRKPRLSARQIVRRAIKNIPNNYPRKLFSTIGYYRDYQMQSGDYVNLNEAIFEVFDYGFATVDTARTRVQIFDYKKNNDFKRDSLSERQYDYKRFQKIIDNAYLKDYGGNEFTILRVHDAIRNYNRSSYSFVDRLDTDLLQNHFFKRENSTYISGEAVYTIDFRKTYPNYTAHGKLYIAHGDYAIHKMEYTLYDDRKKKPKGTLNKHNGRGQLLLDVVTEYRRKYNKMYLNYISAHNSFILMEPPKFKIDYFTVDRGLGCYIVEFNNIPNAIEAVDKKNYTVKFEGKRQQIKSIVVDSNLVYLFPEIKEVYKRVTFAKLSDTQRQKLSLEDLLSIKVKPITDVSGNILNKWQRKNYNQFREFFTQQLKTSTQLPKEGKLMDLRKPIFDNQPISPPENFDDYWMNTPLQKIEIKKPAENLEIVQEPDRQ